MTEPNLGIILKKIERKAGRPYDSQVIDEAKIALERIMSRTTNRAQSENTIFQILNGVADNISSFYLAPKTVVEMIDVRELGRIALERAQDDYRTQFADGSITSSQAGTIIRAVYLQGEGKERINQHHLGYTSSGLKPASTHISTSRDPSNRTSRQGFT
ncbi:hypothetical protein AUJ84_01440 [Candidatus Pacearchaeota archaeon CG1_02_32_132]|nr:MAG: hypothetical protein AUJ84_01440 [Candidatus Pacearchaeota archaeon CG1_02_32_132]